MVATAIILNIVAGHTSSVKVGVLPQTAAVADALRGTGDALGQKVTVVPVPDVAAGDQQVRDGDLDAVLVQTGGTVQVVVEEAAGRLAEVHPGGAVAPARPGRRGQGRRG